MTTFVASMMPPPMARPSRPYYMDTLYRDQPRTPSLSSGSHRSADSVSSSEVNIPTADSRYDLTSKYNRLRTLTPAQEDDNEDRSSLRSFASSFTFKRPKWRILQKLHRRNHTATESTINFGIINEPTTPTRKLGHMPSYSQLHGRQNSSLLTLSPRSPITTLVEAPQELSSRRCYYSIARNCSGWVIGGNHGDACETCLRNGFFGSP